MHKFIRIMAVLSLLAIVLVASAGQVYDRSAATTTAAATGVITITPAFSYAGIELKKAWVEAAPATNVIATVYRVIDSGAYTQSVATVTCGTLTAGSGVPAQYAAIKSGEYFYITTAIATVGTNATVILDYEIQRHD